MLQPLGRVEFRTLQDAVHPVPGLGRRPGKYRGCTGDRPVLGEPGDIGDCVDQQRVPFVVHRGGREVEPKVQEVALPPDGGGRRGLVVDPAADHLELG
jgi:hypothetical protein